MAKIYKQICVHRYRYKQKEPGKNEENDQKSKRKT